MNAAAITSKGIEKVTQTEISELIGCNSDAKETVVLFDASYEKLCEFSYKAQSVSRVLQLISCTRTNNHLEESITAMKHSLEEADLSMLKNRTFRVNCSRSGEQDYSSQDIASAVGDIIVHLGEAKVSLESPEIILLVYICAEECYIGIDVAGFDLSKRDYKVFAHPSSLNGTTAYGLLRLAGYKNGLAVLDPFCGAGTIPIEAALFASGISPHFFKKDKFMFSSALDLPKLDKRQDVKGISAFDYLLRFVIAAKKNASIAGVEKLIAISKVDVEWLDTKVDEHSIDIIVTHSPSPSKVQDSKELQKLYREFLYQAEFVLKADGRMAIIIQNDGMFRQGLAGNDKFTLQAEQSIWQGKQELKVILLSRSTQKI